MPLVDTEGRLFGRFNLIDAAVVLLLLGLLPLAYAAYFLFQTPMPRLTAVEPATLVRGSNLRVSVRGENLRPYMRVSFGSTQGNSFIFRNVGEASVDLNDMPPGVYDVILYDTSQERSRLPNAFTLLATPLPDSQVVLIGTLGNLTAERAAQVKAGMALSGVGEVLAVGRPMPESTRVFAGAVLEIPVDKAVRLPVTVRAGCAVRAPQGVPQCTVGDAPLAPTSLLLVDTPLGKLPFQLDAIRGLQPLEPLQIVAQFTARREIVSQIRVADVDHGQYVNPLAGGAVVKSIDTAVRLSADTDGVDVTLSASGQRGTSSWIYASAPVRVGAPFTLRTPRYEVQGVVLRLDPEWTATQTLAGNARR